MHIFFILLLVSVTCTSVRLFLDRSTDQCLFIHAHIDCLFYYELSLQISAYTKLSLTSSGDLRAAGFDKTVTLKNRTELFNKT